MDPTLYEVLGVASDVTRDDIEVHYSNLSSPTKQQQFAYGVLSDERKRACYNEYTLVGQASRVDGIVRVVGDIDDGGWYRILGVVGFLHFVIPMVKIRINSKVLTVQNVECMFEAAKSVSSPYTFTKPKPQGGNYIWGKYDNTRKISRKERKRVVVKEGGFMWLEGIYYLYDSAMFDFEFV